MHPLLFLENPYFPPHVAYAWFLAVTLFVLSFLAARRLSIYPGRFQNVMEVIIGGFDALLNEIMGHNGRRFFPLIATLGIFILTANLLGIIPGFESPTSSINTTAALAIVVFLSTHVVGVRTHGVKYFKQFMGPVWWLTPLMVPIEIISHFSRPLSLTFRLFGNIKVEDIVLLVVLFLVPTLVPLPVFILMIFISFFHDIITRIFANSF